VAATDNVVLVGAYGDAGNGKFSGSAYVFEKNSTGQYQQVSKLMANDSAAFHYFGRSVAATDTMLVVGAYGDGDNGEFAGSTYVFEKNSTGQYQQVRKLVANDGAAADIFGYAVAATDSMVVVGAYWHDDKGIDAGSAYVFE
jgi:sucrose-6-phosphate hydrolase SacC (GH32 family)